MKVLWLFPPMGKGFPNVSQYRFYKRMPIRASIIYPYLAASGVTQIRDAGHDVELIDCPTEEKTWADISAAVSAAELIILEGRTPIMKQIWLCITKLKMLNPQVKVAVYGDHVSWDPDETLGHGADFIIEGGDYDVAAAYLCGQLQKREDPGMIINVGLDRNLDDLPWVDRELVNWRSYYEAWSKRDVFLWNMAMRGCWFQCIYCAWVKTFWQNLIRYRSPRLVADETEQLVRRYGDLEILDDSDIFDFRWGLRFALELLNKGFHKKEVLWSCQTHPAQIRDLYHLGLMKASGLRVVKLGIESSHDCSLKEMKKGASRRMIEKAIKKLQAAGIMVHANMMVGFPWESREMVLESVEWLKKLDPNQAQFSLLIPYPNTEIWKDCKSTDFFLQDPENWSLYDASYPMVKMEGLTGDEIVELYQECWRSFYLNWKYIWRHLKTIRHWEGIKHLWKGFRSIYFGHMKAVKKRGC